MTLTDITQWLEPLIDSGTLGIGKAPDAEKCVTLYDDAGGGEPVLAMGGVRCTSYDVLPIRLLIRWGQNKLAAMRQAQIVYDALLHNKLDIPGVQAFLSLTCQRPIPVDTDKHGRYEYVITAKIIFER